MGDPARSECPAAIFCGGDHRRLGRLAGMQAKALLVPFDTPLLWRLIDQLCAAGFDRIVAATTPRLERQIRDSVEHYERTSPSDGRIEVRVSAEQERGLLFGLLPLLSSWSSERCLICLGDIFFLANPFHALREHVEAGHDCLGVTPAWIEDELTRGGIVQREADRVRRVLERPATVVTGDPLRWSGIALSHRVRAIADLELFASAWSDGAPPGDFFEFQLGRGRDIRCVSVPDFVNVNAPDDLLLASLYARLEADSVPGPVSRSLRAAAGVLRRELARPTPRLRSR